MKNIIDIKKFRHVLPEDIKKELELNPSVLEKWNTLTPIAQSDWICWVTNTKTKRLEHIERLIEELNQGKRRPCCWAGCPHRNPNAMKWYRN